MWLKFISSLAALVFLFLILTTGSISNLLVALLVSFFVILIYQKNWKSVLTVILVFAAIIGVFILLLQLPFFSYFKDRIINVFSTIFENGEKGFDGSSSNRFDAVITALKLSSFRLVFGFGYMKSTSFTFLNIQAHNNFAELLLDYGLVGLFLFECLVLLPLFKSFKIRKNHAIVPLMFYVLVFQLFLTTYYKKFEFIIFAYSFAALHDEFKFNFVLHNSSIFRRDRTKKIIFEIIPSFTPIGGAETFFKDFVIGLKNRNYDNLDIKVVCLYHQIDNKILTELKNHRIEVFELDKKKGIDVNASFKLRELILQYNPAIIHTHLLSLTSLKIALPFKRRRMKLFHTIHHNFSGNNKAHKLLKHLVKINYLVPICVAENPSKAYSKYLGKETTFINNGVNVMSFNSNKPLYDRKIDFLIAGRFVEIKNQKAVISLISKYEDLKQYNTVFLGDGPMLEECRKMADELGITSSVKFEGFKENVNDYLADSKVLVMPSLNEGNPIIINESFASGLAIVGNDVGGIHDLLLDVSIGGLSNINQEDNFKNKMVETISKINNDKILKIDYSSKNFNIEFTIDEYIKLFGLSDYVIKR